MAYFLNLFDAETWAVSRQHGFSLCGFSPRQRTQATRIKPGDVFLCYLVGLSRWCGALRATSAAYDDPTPFYADPDPWTVRIKVEPVVTLEPEQALPIFIAPIWKGLSATRTMDEPVSGWAVAFRASLKPMSKEDGDLLMRLMRAQSETPQPYPFTERDQRQLAKRGVVPSAKGDVVVEVPDPEDEPPHQDAPEPETATRESLKVQTTLARVGALLGFDVWIAPGDKRRVAELLGPVGPKLLDRLPFNYEERTLRTVEQIDVIWIKGRSIARAFEVEHTTAIYSGLLRMADLMALQPNLSIKLHIVAPDDKREKVLSEIRRPVFSLLENGPLYDSCTYLSYDSLTQVAALPHLSHMSASVLDEFEEYAGRVGV